MITICCLKEVFNHHGVRAPGENRFFRAMERCRLIIALIFVLTLVAIPPLHAQELEGKTFKVRGDDNYPPYEYLDDNGNPTGFNIDLVKAATKVMGLTLEIDLGPWKQVRSDLEAGRIDILAGMFYSAERDKLVDFSTPHIVVSHSIFVRSESGVRRMEDLEGREILVQRGDIMHDYVVSNHISDSIMAVENPADALRRLAMGQGAGALLAKLQGLFLIDKYGLRNLRAVGPPILPRKYCFAVRKGDSELLATLNEGLSLLKSTGQYQEIYEKWFGVLEPGRSTRQLFVWSLWIVIPFLLLLVVALGWSWALKRKVQQRTMELSTELTERRKVEEALRNSETNYRLLVENSNDVSYRLDLTGKIIYVSPVLKRKVGLEVQEVFGRSYSDFIFPEDLPLLKSRFKELQPYDDHFILEFRIKNGDGQILWFRSSNRWFYIGALPAGLNGVLTDITERKNAELALVESEKRFRDIWNQTPIGAAIIGLDGAIIRVNPQFLRMTGYEEEEILSLRLKDIVHPDYAARDSELMTRMKVGESENLEYETKYLKKDGAEIWIRVTLRLVAGADGRPDYFLPLAEDVTRRKQAEMEKEELEKQLFQAQKMEAIGVLAGGLAHDINNLLMGIMGNANLAEFELFPKHPAVERLRRIEQCVQSGSDLTKRLLGFARGGKYELKPADLNQLTKKALEMFGRAKKEVSVHFEPLPGVHAVEVDRNQIEQVLLNILVNAWQAMPHGGDIYVKIENEALNGEAPGECGALSGDFVKTAVTDSGVGMDEDTQRRVFDPFFTTKDMGRGVGLGLASVYGIIKNHGGCITVDSRPGRGSTFTFYLPASSNAAVQEVNYEERVVPGAGIILLVDDEPMVLNVGAAMLEKLGYRVLTADSGEEAVNILKARPGEIDLVILDMIMPGQSGGRTFDIIKSIEPEIKVLLSSGYSLNGDAEEIMKRGCNGFIQKPFSLQSFSRKIREIMQA